MSSKLCTGTRVHTLGSLRWSLRSLTASGTSSTSGTTSQTTEIEDLATDEDLKLTKLKAELEAKKEAIKGRLNLNDKEFEILKDYFNSLTTNPFNSFKLFLKVKTLSPFSSPLKN